MRGVHYQPLPTGVTCKIEIARLVYTHTHNLWCPNSAPQLVTQYGCFTTKQPTSDKPIHEHKLPRLYETSSLVEQLLSVLFCPARWRSRQLNRSCVRFCSRFLSTAQLTSPRLYQGKGKANVHLYINIRSYDSVHCECDSHKRAQFYLQTTPYT